MTPRSTAALASLELSSSGLACHCCFDAFEVKRGKHGGQMSFSVEITPRKDTKGAIVHAVTVTIDRHETILTFVSKDDAEKFAQVEHARLMASDKNASQRFREIAYHLWQEEGCPEGEALRRWFSAKAGRDDGGGEARPLARLPP